MAFRVLEISPNAAEEEIRNAHRVMVKVWHPDRFQGDARMRAAAEAKLKEINAAYDLLTSRTSAGASGRQRPPQGGTAQKRTVRPRTTAPAARSGFTSAQIRFGLGLAFKCLLGLIALLLCRYLWIAFDVRNTTSEAASTVLDYSKDKLNGPLAAPKRRFLAAIEDDLERLGFSKPAPQPTAVLQAEPPASVGSPRSGHTTAANPGTRPAANGRATLPKVHSFITVGSTRDEILDQVGTPTDETANKLVYGRSELYLKDNSVVGWHIDLASPIRVKLWPSTAVDPTLDSFTVGSSRDVVLVVQGTPTSFSEDKFEYGGSVVNFQNRRVVSWKSDPASIPLRAR
jgi:hypothetical protein